MQREKKGEEIRGKLRCELQGQRFDDSISRQQHAMSRDIHPVHRSNARCSRPRNRPKIWSVEREITIKSLFRPRDLRFHFPIIVGKPASLRIGRLLFTAHRFFKLSRAASVAAGICITTRESFVIYGERCHKHGSIDYSFGRSRRYSPLRLRPTPSPGPRPILSRSRGTTKKTYTVSLHCALCMYPPLPLPLSQRYREPTLNRATCAKIDEINSAAAAAAVFSRRAVSQFQGLSLSLSLSLPLPSPVPGVTYAFCILSCRHFAVTFACNIMR